MATSRTQLANLALMRLGGSLLTDLDADDTEEASKCRLLFEELRDQLLVAGHWAFAIKRVALALLGTEPAYGFSYKHQLPTDCLLVISVNDEVYYHTEYKIEGTTLLTDDNLVYIRYVAQISDPAQWSPMFKQTFVLRLALELSYDMRADKQLTEMLARQYLTMLHEALAIDGQQGTADLLVANDLNEVR